MVGVRAAREVWQERHSAIKWEGWAPNTAEHDALTQRLRPEGLVTFGELQGGCRLAELRPCSTPDILFMSGGVGTKNRKYGHAQ